MRAIIAVLLVAGAAAGAERIVAPGLEQPVEILRDRWGVPHIYAKTSDDLFFAQGYIAARDRLFQIDLWRRAGTGKLSEVMGEQALNRDRLARAIRYRGDWNREWQAYAPDAKQIVTAFVNGINAYIRGLHGKRPEEFRIAGYDPGLWTPQDCAARLAGLVMVRNIPREVARVQDIQQFGLHIVQKDLPPDPDIPIEIPRGLDLADITPEVLRAYDEAVRPFRPAEQGSNDWVVDGSMTVTGKPILANDPHRPVQIPSLRKTYHLVGPGWNAFGAGEPALPGIAVGHNEHIGFGFTIVGIDQADLYVETLKPDNPAEYLYKGQWRPIETEHDSIPVKGRPEPVAVILEYTIHGPVIYKDPMRHRAFALRWVGAEPGGAGYLSALSLARAQNWQQFLKSVERYKIPSENIVYADVDGNIGWQASGLTPIRRNWSGLLPVPGASGEYEWSGFRALAEQPRLYNPPAHFVATANHNILPPGYQIPLGYEWALPFRYQRIREMLSTAKKFSVEDFERMQQDVTSLPARRFQAVLRKWTPPPALAGTVRELLAWDARMTRDSRAALIYEEWTNRLPETIFGAALGRRVNLERVLVALEKDPNPRALADSLSAALEDIGRRMGPDRSAWRWGRLHKINFQHPSGVAAFNRGPLDRPGDANTVNATSGAGFQQVNGASYREVLDLADWDRSMMTNVPGESGDPASPHYDDLIDGWNNGVYHPMPFSRAAVEAATTERILLVP